ncbi:GNAT family N-acetyltransferase [Parasediminibacterium paludis]|uniref:GNAT family N-acetyltransferase n=1 Tax=Parasediminibacterium paludis TaxID=908966 RepID=A0ABV8PUU6_9BACT
MVLREAATADITQMQLIRNAVKENTLSNPALVSDADCEKFINTRGKGWVCTIDDNIVGFAIVDLQAQNIWALFVHPDFENKGIGKQLHNLMLNWYFDQTKATVWLGTSPNTRAATFYKLMGWKAVGMHGTKELKFEMTHQQWQQQKSKR